MSREDERPARYIREALRRGALLGRDNEGKEQVVATPESFAVNTRALGRELKTVNGVLMSFPVDSAEMPQ